MFFSKSQSSDVSFVETIQDRLDRIHNMNSLYIFFVMECLFSIF